jgi:hypothetical protein
VCVHIFIFIFKFKRIFIFTYMLPFQMKNGKQKPRRFSLIRSPFARRANGSSSFVSLFTKKQREVIRLQTD